MQPFGGACPCATATGCAEISASSGRGDVAEAVHPLEHLVAPGRRVLGVGDRVVVGRALHQAGEHRRLRQREVDGVDAEVRLGGGLDAVGALAEVHDVQVAGEDLVLRVLLLQGQREPGLAQLAADALLVGGRLRSSGVVAVCSRVCLTSCWVSVEPPSCTEPAATLRTRARSVPCTSRPLWS